MRHAAPRAFKRGGHGQAWMLPYCALSPLVHTLNCCWTLWIVLTWRKANGRLLTDFNWGIWRNRSEISSLQARGRQEAAVIRVVVSHSLYGKSEVRVRGERGARRRNALATGSERMSATQRQLRPT
ncbi:hypothetical protein EJ03DRAFT_77991 [Teratosphaeria nubilosa]|uniref:Uncharacterized protein n=1 Tax=Teratosphaeria nubilosa TaxID=161662 RepID=A0A6G1LDM4_9PEZI|nr:hypothetical protein EJ03DRAFT_77991 [Teratosphaeria nubilosa]